MQIDRIVMDVWFWAAVIFCVRIKPPKITAGPTSLGEDQNELDGSSAPIFNIKFCCLQKALIHKYKAVQIHATYLAYRFCYLVQMWGKWFYAEKIENDIEVITAAR